MAETRIADVIVPEIFLPYMNAVLEQSPFFESGIVRKTPVELGSDLTSGGNTITMPYWDNLVAGTDTLSDASALELTEIKGKADKAVIQFRGKAFGSNDLAHQLAGSDPMKAIAGQFGNFWARSLEKLLFAELKGVFGAVSMAGNKLDISAKGDASAVITSDALLDASQLLGDKKSTLTAIAMHSAVENKLAKDNLIEAVRDETGKFLYKSYMGKRVVVSDYLPNEDGAYTTYLFGEGAIGYNEGGVLKPLETDRDTLAGIDTLVTRKAFVLHPFGVSWTGSAVGATPTDVELSTGENWTRVYPNKNIAIVALKAKVATA